MVDKNNNKLIAGVDEVGRGPLAGPVIACAVILNPDKPISGLRDSKKLSPKKRESLAQQIHEQALSVGIGRAEAAEIDDINILQASLVAMERALRALDIEPQLILVDGNKTFDSPIPQKAIIGGDDLYPEISAASIVAKVLRDNEMIALDGLYPEYGFASHKGYPTKVHREAIKSHGVTPLHRRSYAPVRALLVED